MLRTIRPSSGGFTLMELLVVISVLTMLTVITARGIGTTMEGNRRVACQGNLYNIAQALKMYRIDEGGYPPFDPSASVGSQGMGLWALYTYGIETDRMGGADPSTGADGQADGIDGNQQPFRGYITTPNALHCPDHRRYCENRTYPCSSPGVAIGGSTHPDVSDAPNDYYYHYNSYQVMDSDSSEWTYLPNRVSPSSPNYSRTLATKFPADNTIVTWCPHHRSKPAPINKDLVLFIDGAVQILDRPSSAGSVGWLRTRE